MSGWRSRCRVCSAATTIAVLGTATSFAQQQDFARGYAFAGIAWPTQGGPTSERRETFLVPHGPGGTTLGWMAGVGFFLVPKASIDVEFLQTGRMGPLREGLRYDATTTEERRDQLLTIGVRLHMLRNQRVQLHPSGGFLMARTERWSQFEQRELFGRLRINPPEHGFFTRIGWTMGIDLTAGNAHVRAGPSLRLHHVSPGSCYSCGMPQSGLWEWSFTPGVTARAIF